jgi:hypothetical protein
MQLLGQPHPQCTIERDGELLRTRVGGMGAQGIQECYRALAALALEHKFTRALVVGVAAGDAVSHLAARDAVIALHMIGVPIGFRLAFVPHTFETLNAFLHAEIEAEKRGLRAKVFSAEAEAVRWLVAPEVH